METTEAVKRYRFYKTNNGSWFVDLPEWTGAPGELQMVAGTDDFLEEVSNGSPEVVVEIATKPIKGFEMLKLVNKQEYGGADYVLSKYQNHEVNKKMWLCDVTNFVFNNFPEEIYFKIV
jgi:hypothetical protein